MVRSSKPEPRSGPSIGRRILSLFLASRNGATTVEFAIISVPFLGLLFAIFQTSLAFLMQQGLKVALDAAARQVLTGVAQGNTSINSWQSFRDTLICNPSGSRLLPSFVTCANIIVDVRPFASFSSMSASDGSSNFVATGAQYQPGTACQIVIVRAAYPMPVFLPVLNPAGPAGTTNKAGLTFYNGKWVQMLSAAAVFRNEPFSAGSC